MNRPFDYIDGKKIDLRIQEHRDEVVKRNKELFERLTNGIDIYFFPDIQIKQIIRVSIDCFVCGSNIENDKTTDFGLKRDYLPLPTLKCDCCKTVYKYDSMNEKYEILIDLK